MPPKIPPKKNLIKEQAKVLFSYTAENDDELTIKEGDLINIISKEIEDKVNFSYSLACLVDLFEMMFYLI